MATNLVEKNYTGTIASVDSKESLLEVKSLVSTKKFNLGSTCVYILLDKRNGTISDLHPDQKVKVSYQDTNGVLIAEQVEQQPQIFEGQVTAVDPIKHTLKVSAHWSDKTFQVASNCVVVLHNEKSGSFADIQSGGHVTVTYETLDNTPIAWQIAQTSASYTGTLTAIDVPNRIIKAKTLFNTKKFNVADKCAIVIDGKTDGQLADLKPNDRLVFSYDEINGVNVANRIAPVPIDTMTNATYVTQPSTGY
jgi:hypothetical protein